MGVVGEGRLDSSAKRRKVVVEHLTGAAGLVGVAVAGDSRKRDERSGPVRAVTGGARGRANCHLATVGSSVQSELPADQRGERALGLRVTSADSKLPITATPLE